MSKSSLPKSRVGGEAPPNSRRPTLSKKHLGDLLASGLTQAIITLAGFYTLTDPARINAMLRRKDGGRIGPCLMVPYHDLDGNRVSGYERAKPDRPPKAKKDGKAAKYLTPGGLEVRPYFPNGAGPAIRDAGRPLAMTEGEKKCLAIWQHGVAAVGLAGVECWSRRRPKGQDGRAQGKRELLDELAGLPGRRRTVYIVFDSDVAQKRDVLRAEASLARALTDLGAVVKLVRIPAPADGSKLGIDDYLVRQADPAAALESLFAKAADSAAAGGRDAAGPYRVRGGQIIRERWTRDGPVDMPLCNFDARIVDEVVRDDGSEEAALVYGIEGRLAGGPPLPRVIVPAERFAAMNWAAEVWGSKAIVYAGQGCKDHLRVAIQSLSDAAQRTVYTHLGWRQIGGASYYLHAGGAIGPAGSAPAVCCDPPRQLRRFALPDPPDGDRLQAAVRASLGLLDGRIRDRVAFPVVAAVYRAPLGPADFATFLAGHTGRFKSELAALAQQHYGPGMDARNFPANWDSTANSLEAIAFGAKDALLVVDDLAPSGATANVQRMHREAERLLRAQGNNAGRNRMAADGSLRAERPPRGLVLATGEDVPHGQSVRARLAVVEVEKGDIPPDALTEFQRAAAAGEYALAMSGYVRHLAPQYGTVRERLAAERAAQRDEFAAAGVHARTPAAFADLALGLKYLLKFAVTCGAITDAERDALWARGRAAFGQLLGEQADHVAAADPVDLFLRLVQAAVASGRAHLAGRAGAEPATDPEAFGWRPRPASPHEQPGWQPQGHRVGWVDGETVYLEPDGAYAEAQRLAAEQGQAIPLGPRTLHRRLNERGLLARVEKAGGKTRYCVRVTLQGQRREVLCLVAATLFPAASAPGAPAGHEIPVAAGDAEWPAGPACATAPTECANGAPGPAPVRPANGPEQTGDNHPVAQPAHSRNGEAGEPPDREWSAWS